MGVRPNFARSRRPHPDPLPEGEGIGSVAALQNRDADPIDRMRLTSAAGSVRMALTNAWFALRRFGEW
jgi:hypothetical protein